MTKTVTHHASDDRTTSRGTVKGEHPRPEDNVPEGGPAPSPTEGSGAPKGSASAARDAGAVAGDDTSTATAGAHEKEHAAGMGDAKPHGRGFRKHDERS